MNKIYQLGNYIVVERGSIINHFSKKLSTFRMINNNFYLKEKVDKNYENIVISEKWYNETGTVLFTDQTMRTFLEANTGV